MPTFDESYAKSIIARLDQIAGGLLTDYQYDIQDDAEFLLIWAELQADLSEHELDLRCAEIKAQIAPLLPKRKEEYAWMITMKRRGNFVASIYADVLDRDG
jgi:hypothetical protein